MVFAGTAAGRKLPGVLLRVEDVTKRYDDGRSDQTVLDRVHLELVRGERVSLMGSSGSGKSTLIALIAGLTRPDEGAIFIDGQNFTSMDSTEQARFRARQIGVVLQRANLFPFLSALENVEFASRLAGHGAQTQLARSLLTEFGLGHRFHHRPKRLSGGECQRVSLAVALVNRPQLLLADEVTGELDSANADRILSLLFDVADAYGGTLLYVTHDATIAARASRRLNLAFGQLQHGCPSS